MYIHHKWPNSALKSPYTAYQSQIGLPPSTLTSKNRGLKDPYGSLKLKKTIPMFAGSIPMLGKHTKANMCIKINPCKNPRTIIYKFWILSMPVRMVITPKELINTVSGGVLSEGKGLDIIMIHVIAICVAFEPGDL